MIQQAEAKIANVQQGSIESYLLHQTDYAVVK